MMLEINPTALFIMVKVYNLTTPWITEIEYLILIMVLRERERES